MSKRKMDKFQDYFDDNDLVEKKRSHKKKAVKVYRWYGITDDIVQVFEGSGPPTKCFTREVYGPNTTEDVDISFCSNGECESINEIELVDFEQYTVDFEQYTETGMLFYGPIPDPDAEEIKKYCDDIPEDRELLDCEDDV